MIGESYEKEYVNKDSQYSVVRCYDDGN